MEIKKQMNKHQFVWYLLIFSIIGLIIETLYCFITTGILESRKGLILGPVCPIYGVGAISIIAGLNQFKDKKLKLLVYGGILGGIVEYFISFVLEALYGTRFWDYSYLSYHLNGRICLIYSIFWALLSLIIIQWVKPLTDKLIEKIKIKYIDNFIFIFFIIDVLLTIWAVNVYTERAISGGREINNSNFFYQAKFYVEESCFSNDIMVKIFPNIRTIDNNGQEIFVRDLINKN